MSDSPPPPLPDSWEQLRHMTLDQFLTFVKLNGSALLQDGHTTPEGWPFVIVVAVASPGNELALKYARDFAKNMTAAASWVKVGKNPKQPRRKKGPMPS